MKSNKKKRYRGGDIRISGRLGSVDKRARRRPHDDDEIVKNAAAAEPANLISVPAAPPTVASQHDARNGEPRRPRVAEPFMKNSPHNFWGRDYVRW
jgi:hypothetical protein